MNAVDEPSAAAPIHWCLDQERILGREMMSSASAPKRKRHALDAAGPIRVKTGITTAADHWIVVVPAKRNATPARVRRRDGDELK